MIKQLLPFIKCARNNCTCIKKLELVKDNNNINEYLYTFNEYDKCLKLSKYIIQKEYIRRITFNIKNKF